MKIIDSHQHFWDPGVLGLPPMPPELAVLDRAFLPRDLAPALRRAGVDYTVVVQGYPQSVACNRWLFEQATEAAFVAGVVAWIDLQSPADLASHLDELQAQPKFVGTRHIVQDEPEGWLLREAVLASLGELARRDIPYDIVVQAQQLGDVIQDLELVPELRLVIDHLGKPVIGRGGMEGWADAMREIAMRPQAYGKLSGLMTPADWHHWRVSDLQSYVDKVLECFGFERVMYGSDWPVCLLAADYPRMWSAINELLGDIGLVNYAKVFGANAIRFYRLNLST